MLHLLAGGLIVVVAALTAGRFLVRADAPAPSDAIVLLGGGDSRRARHAVDLYRHGYAPQVVFSGGTFKDVGLACSSAQLSLEAAQELGLPDGVSVIAPEAQSTYDEAVNLAGLAEEHGWSSLLVVTDPFHTRRAGRTFQNLMTGVEISVSAAPNPDYDPGRWWQTEDGLVAVFSEVLKLGYYWARYGIAPF